MFNSLVRLIFNCQINKGATVSLLSELSLLTIWGNPNPKVFIPFSDSIESVWLIMLSKDLARLLILNWISGSSFSISSICSLKLILNFNGCLLVRASINWLGMSLFKTDNLFKSNLYLDLPGIEFNCTPLLLPTFNLFCNVFINLSDNCI